MKRILPVLCFILAMAGMAALPSLALAASHGSTMGVTFVRVTSHVTLPLATCFEDGCDGLFPSPGDENCTFPNRVQTANMVDSHGVIEGHLYMYYTTGGSNCGYAVWGTAVLFGNLIYPNNISVYTSRTSAGEVVNEVGSYSENVSKGTYMDAPMVGYEPPSHVCDSVNAAADWYDQYSHAEHTQTVSECFN